MRTIQAAHSHGDTRLFRTHNGIAYAGKVVSRTKTHITLENYRPITLGVPGMSDLTGITEGGRYAAVEVKVPCGRTDPDRLAAQMRFIATIRQLGGRAGFATDVESAGRILRGEYDE